jgi:hypothetical protein
VKVLAYGFLHADATRTEIVEELPRHGMASNEQRGHIEEAFRHKEMADENRRLQVEVRQANQELARISRQLMSAGHRSATAVPSPARHRLRRGGYSRPCRWRVPLVRSAVLREKMQ